MPEGTKKHLYEIVVNDVTYKIVTNSFDNAYKFGKKTENEYKSLYKKLPYKYEITSIVKGYEIDDSQ